MKTYEDVIIYAQCVISEVLEDTNELGQTWVFHLIKPSSETISENLELDVLICSVVDVVV
jgi:hypothetical protein